MGRQKQIAVDIGNEVESQNGLFAVLAINERSRIAEWFVCCAGH